MTGAMPKFPLFENHALQPAAVETIRRILTNPGTANNMAIIDELLDLHPHPEHRMPPLLTSLMSELDTLNISKYWLNNLQDTATDRLSPFRARLRLEINQWLLAHAAAAGFLPQPCPNPLIQPQLNPIITAVESHRGTVVLSSSDDFSFVHFWLSDMTGPELEQWWTERDHFWSRYISPPRGTEEEEREREACERTLAAIFGEELPPSPWPIPGPPMVLPGTFLDGESQDLWDFWSVLDESHLHYRKSDGWSDHDSWLLTPDSRRIYHKGFVGVRLA